MKENVFNQYVKTKLVTKTILDNNIEVRFPPLQVSSRSRLAQIRKAIQSEASRQKNFGECTKYFNPLFGEI